MWTRANVNVKQYSTVCDPEWLWKIQLTPPKERQYILRMMVACPGHELCIPNELQWLKGLIERCLANQMDHDVVHPFIYVTVRHGQVTSTTDDDWHVDGFSTRIPHGPEQNYIWMTSPATEILGQSFDVPNDFDPLRHNLHWYFQDRADESLVYPLDSETVVLIDPYVSFVPIEIRDDGCIQNSLLPSKTYGTVDFRNKLVRYG